VDSDRTLVYLAVAGVAARHYANYSLRAGNMVGSAMATVRLVPRAAAAGDKASGSGGEARGGRSGQRQRDASHAVAEVFRSPSSQARSHAATAHRPHGQKTL